jgi:hypothetical protein
MMALNPGMNSTAGSFFWGVGQDAHTSPAGKIRRFFCRLPRRAAINATKPAKDRLFGSNFRSQPGNSRETSAKVE